MSYEIEDVVRCMELLLAEVDPERRDLVAEESGAAAILDLLQQTETAEFEEVKDDGAEEEGTDAEVAVTEGEEPEVVQ